VELNKSDSRAKRLNKVRPAQPLNDLTSFSLLAKVRGLKVELAAWD